MAVSVEEHLQNFINQIAAEQKFDVFETKITPVFSDGANFTSNLFKVKITQEGRDDLYLFAKVAALNETMRGQALFKPFDNERLFYNSLAKTYKKLEESHGVTDKLKMSGYYGADATHGREIMVLEDLTTRGFCSPNRFKSVDWSYAAGAITELAKFHALSMAFKHENPEEFDKFLAPISTGFFVESDMFNEVFKVSISTVLQTVNKNNKEKLEAFLKENGRIKKFNDLYKPLNCKVIIHADYRPNNMLHKVLPDGSTEVIPVDYQTFQAGSPVIDLYYFIFSSSDGPFRSQYFKKLINHYYAELGRALQGLGLNVDYEYPRNDFEQDLKEKLPFGLLLTSLFLHGFLVPEDQAPAIGSNFTDMASLPTGELYNRRLNEVVDDFVSWGVL